MTPVKDSTQRLHGGQHGQAFPKPRADINVMSTEWSFRDYKMASWAHYALTPYVPSTADKACSCTYSFISSYLPFASMNQTLCLGLRHRNVQGSAPTCHVGQRDEDESIPHPLCRPWSPLPGRQSCTHHLPSHFPQHIAPSSPLPTGLCALVLRPAPTPFLSCFTWRKCLPSLLKDGCFWRRQAGKAKLVLSEKNNFQQQILM